MLSLPVTSKLEALTQADGAQEIDLKEHNRFSVQQLQIEVSAQPSAGTLTIAIKTPGANIYCNLDDTVDMTALTATEGISIRIDAFAENIKVTPTGFDADKTYNVYAVSM